MARHGKRCGFGNNWNENNNWSYGDGGGGTSISTATLMKTGQTTSYRTGDDGDLEAGRGASFLVLAENNPFGNTDRFTDRTGSQTYADDIVIDWSTNSGTSVVGYIKTQQSAAIWDTAIDNCVAYTNGTYTSGWRVPNINECASLIDWGRTGDYLNYAPFNYAAGNRWSSTTSVGSTSDAYFLWGSAIVPISYYAKSTAFAYMICRTFTVSGTTLT